MRENRAACPSHLGHKHCCSWRAASHHWVRSGPQVNLGSIQHRAKLTAFNHSLHFFYCNSEFKKKRFILSPHHCCPGKDKTLVLTLADEDCYLSLRHFRKIISFSFFFTPKPLYRATTLEMSVLCWYTVLCQASLHLYLCRVAAWVLGSRWEPRG